MNLVAGVDSSTQSTKVLLCRADDGSVVAEAAAPHPDGTECHPDRWWEALTAAGRDLLERADAVGVAAQQHGMVVLDDGRRGDQARHAVERREVGAAGAGPGRRARRPRRVGRADRRVPTMSFTVTKLRWLAENEPDNARRVRRVVLPHDWLTWRLAGGGPAPAGDPALEPTTDRGDASGTGYFSPADGRWLPDLAATALGHPVELPRVAGPAEVVGRDLVGRGAVGGHRGQHGRGAGPAAARRRRGGVDRHLRGRLRGDG